VTPPRLEVNYPNCADSPLPKIPWHKSLSARLLGKSAGCSKKWRLMGGPAWTGSNLRLRVLFLLV